MKKIYKHIFFDLDHTLWDYESNAKLTLFELHDRFELDAIGISTAQEFYFHFTKINDELWNQFNVGKITKFELRDSRFPSIFEASGAIMKMVPDDLFKRISRDFILECSKKSGVFAGAKEILDYLQPNYPLHIITNGFEETQSVKLKSAGIDRYFNQVITSERAGSKKPLKGIFNYAMKHAKAVPEDSIMIGDNLIADIKGARDFGIDQVYFNPEKKPHQQVSTYEISNLTELKSIL